MNQDMHPKHQPEGTYRLALNAVLETKEGDIMTISNELGNELCASLPNKPIVGKTIDHEGNIILLFAPDEIGIYSPSTCTYTSKIVASCLNFSAEHPVNVLHNLRNGCDSTIILTDNFNDYRMINLTDTATITDCSAIEYTRDFNTTCAILYKDAFSLGINNYGGSLLTGVYRFFIRFLDKDLNPTNWVFDTRPIPIGQGSYTSNNYLSTYTNYTGGDHDLTVNIVPTSKSITLQFSTLDTRFQYMEIAVVKNTNMDGSISGIDLLQPVVISGPTMNFVYSGLDNQVTNQLSLEELLEDKQRIKKVVAHAQKDNRLYMAGVSNPQIDYTAFQRHASKIKVEHVQIAVDGHGAFDKQGEYYLGGATGSLMHDEIYSLGLVYIFDDGTTSPVFMIPGRAANTNIVGTNHYISTFTNWDTDIVDSSDPNKLSSLGMSQRWQTYNTSTAYTTPYGGTQISGLLGYHEVKTATYPTIATCDGSDYWGTDWQGNALTGTKIRHHRMPGFEHRAAGTIAGDTSEHMRLGLRFSNIDTYPAPNIVGHYYVYSDRTYEHTIADRGLLFQMKIPANDTTRTIPYSSETYKLGKPISPAPADNGKTMVFISNKQNFYGVHAQGGYVKMDKYLVTPNDDFANWIAGNKTVLTQGWAVTFSNSIMYSYFREYGWPTQINHAINQQGFLPKASVGSTWGNQMYIVDDLKTFINNSVNLNLNVLHLDVSPTDLNTLPEGPGPRKYAMLASIKVDRDVFANIYSIEYIRMRDCKFTKPSLLTSGQIVFGGDAHICQTNISDYSWSQTEDQLNNGPIVSVHGNHWSFMTEDNIHSSFRGEWVNSPRPNEYTFFHNDYSSTAAPNSAADKYLDYIISKYYHDVYGAGEPAKLHPEHYIYNKSYSILEHVRRYYPIPFNYELCNECREEFPYRIYYSEYDGQESTVDNYRYVKPNNYKDLDGNTGPITDLFTNFNTLYALTTHTAYYLPINPQQMQTTDGTIYIGTGEMLAVPPQQLKTTDYQFGGTTQFTSRTNTEYGVAYMDDISGRVFLIDNQLNDLTTDGLRNFFQENGAYKLSTQFKKKLGIAYPTLSTPSRMGIGYNMTYCPRTKRLIITKKDFEIKSDYLYSLEAGSNITTPNILWFDTDTNQFKYNATTGTIVINVDDQTYFYNKSYTLSYSFIFKCWVSHHSYLPYSIFNDYKTFYSSYITPTGEYSNGWEHNRGLYNHYYGSYYPHFVDLIATMNPIEAKLSANIFYTSQASIYSPIDGSFTSTDHTFTNMIAYNSMQSTGKKSVINNKSSFNFATTNDEVRVDKVDNLYKISALRDYATSNTIWDYVNVDVQRDVNRVPININLGISLFDQKRLRDHYLGLRLIYDPNMPNAEPNLKFNTDIVNTMFANRNR